jgi:hypothetical protein
MNKNAAKRLWIHAVAYARTINREDSTVAIYRQMKSKYNSMPHTEKAKVLAMVK